MGRSPCCDKNGMKKGPWTPEEDLKLIEYIQVHGPGNWRTLPKNAGLQRCGKSCRLRWTNYLRPDIKRGRFSFEEEEAIIQLHSILGNKWSAIAARLPGRTDNEIKNYWNTHIRKRLLRMGIDPVTHSPRLDLLDLSSILNSNHLNLSNFLGLQTLLNPEILRILSTIQATNQENPDSVLQNLQENQLLKTQMQNQTPIFQPNNQFQEQILNQTPPPMQGNLGQLPVSTSQNFQNDFAPSNLNENLSSYGYFGSDQITRTNLPQNPASQSLNSNQSYGIDSVISTPLSSPAPLNSSSTFINNSSTEDERDSYCSNMLRFEIPEGLDLQDFM